MVRHDFAGIIFDYREPIPPEFLAQLQLQEPCPVIPPHVDVQPFERFVAGGGYDNNDVHRVRELHHGAEEAPVEPVLEQGRLPPLSTSLVVRVVEDAAKVTVTQLFWNTEDTPIHKGSYTFPLPSGCTVTDFSCRVGRNRVIRAKVKPRREAREAFDGAVLNNQTAALVEQNTPEIFTTTLGRIPPNTKLKAELSFVTLLKHKFEDGRNRTTLTIPTNIANRYGIPPPEFLGATPSSPLRGLKIEIEVVTSGTVQNISSPTHNVTIEHGVGRRQYENWEDFAAAIGTNNLQTSMVNLADDLTCLDRDFVLNITTHAQDELEIPHAVLEEHPSFPNHRAIMLTIPPNFMFHNEPSSEEAEILFVADRSGSMDDKMQSVKSAMGFFLEGIPEGRKFNIWCFGSGHTALWNYSRSYSAENLAEALNYVEDRFEADMGGTELLPALKKIVTARDPTRHTEIVVLTDGEVWSLDETIEFVTETKKRTEGKVRFFALGIGDAVSHELVEGIAKAGGGYAEVIPAASQGGWEDRVVSMLRSALKGHLGPIRISLDARPQSDVVNAHGRTGTVGHQRPPFLQSPADVSALSPFLRNRIFFLFDSQGSTPAPENIRIKSTPPGGAEIETLVRVKPLQTKEIPIHKLGARALLGDLERGQSWIHLGHCRRLLESFDGWNMVRREGEKMGVKWSLVSKWTSLYAVEEPYRPDGNNGDPFFDADDVRVQEVNHDPGLLRPRGTPSRRLDSLIPTLENPSRTSPDNGNSQDDEDEDTVSDSENSNHEGDDDVQRASDDADEDSDDEDDSGPPGGGSGAAAEGGDNNNMGGEHQPPSRQSGGRAAGAGAGGQRSNNDRPARNGSDPDSSAKDSENHDDPGPTKQQASAHEVTYKCESRPLVFGDHPGRSGYAPSRTILPLLGSLPSISPAPGTLLPPTLKPVPVDKGSRHAKVWSLKRDTTPSQPAKRPAAAEYSPLSKPSKFSTTKSRKAAWEDERDDEMDDEYDIPLGLDLSDPVCHKFQGEGDFPVVTDKESGISRSSSKASNLITAPSFNPPASAALALDQGAEVKTVQQREGEEFVARLLTFQKFDGSFSFIGLFDVQRIFGDDFEYLVASVAQQPRLRHVDKTVVLNIAIVAFLELKLQFCKDLWALMVSKTRSYVDGRLREGSGPIPSPEELYEDMTARLLRLTALSEIARSQTDAHPEVVSPIETDPSAFPTLADTPEEMEPHVPGIGTGTFRMTGAVLSYGAPKPAPVESPAAKLQSLEVVAPTETCQSALPTLADNPEENQVHITGVQMSKETEADATPMPAVEPQYQPVHGPELAASAEVDRSAPPKVAGPAKLRKTLFSRMRARFTSSDSSKTTEANTSPKPAPNSTPEPAPKPATIDSTSQPLQRSNMVPPGQERLGSLPVDEW